MKHGYVIKKCVQLVFCHLLIINQALGPLETTNNLSGEEFPQNKIRPSEKLATNLLVFGIKELLDDQLLCTSLDQFLSTLHGKLCITKLLLLVVKRVFTLHHNFIKVPFPHPLQLGIF